MGSLILILLVSGGLATVLGLVGEDVGAAIVGTAGAMLAAGLAIQSVVSWVAAAWSALF